MTGRVAVVASATLIRNCALPYLTSKCLTHELHGHATRCTIASLLISQLRCLQARFATATSAGCRAPGRPGAVNGTATSLVCTLLRSASSSYMFHRCVHASNNMALLTVRMGPDHSVTFSSVKPVEAKTRSLLLTLWAAFGLSTKGQSDEDLLDLEVVAKTDEDPCCRATARDIIADVKRWAQEGKVEHMGFALGNGIEIGPVKPVNNGAGPKRSRQPGPKARSVRSLQLFFD